MGDLPRQDKLDSLQSAPIPSINHKAGFKLRRDDAVYIGTHRGTVHIWGGDIGCT